MHYWEDMEFGRVWVVFEHAYGWIPIRRFESCFPLWIHRLYTDRCTMEARVECDLAHSSTNISENRESDPVDRVDVT